MWDISIDYKDQLTVHRGVQIKSTRTHTVGHMQDIQKSVWRESFITMYTGPSIGTGISLRNHCGLLCNSIIRCAVDKLCPYVNRRKQGDRQEWITHDVKQLE